MKQKCGYSLLIILLWISNSKEQEFFKNDLQKQSIFSLILSEEMSDIYEKIILPSEKDNWENKYWNIIDPTPNTAKNEYYEELLARFEYAKKYYANIFAPLFLDDRGKYYIKYGEPDDRVFSNGVGKAYRDNETWAYYDKNLFIDFVDQTGFGFREVNSLLDAISSGPANVKIGAAAELYAEREVLHQMYSSFREVLNGGLGYATESAFYRLTSEMTAEKKLMLQAAQPATFSYSYHKEPLNAKLSSAIFRGEYGFSRVEFYYAFPMSELTFHQGSHVSLETLVDKELTIFNNKFEKVLHKSETLKLVALDENQIQKQFYINQHNEELTSGNYNIALRFDNINGKSLAILRAQLQVRDFSADTLSVSDIQLSANIFEGGSERQKLKANAVLVVPYIGSTIDKQRPLFIYFEIYNLAFADKNHTKFRISYEVSAMANQTQSTVTSAIQFFSRLVGKNQTQETIGSSFEAAGDNEFQQIYLSIDFSKFASGTCRLAISVDDLISGRSVQTEKRLILK